MRPFVEKYLGHLILLCQVLKFCAHRGQVYG